MGLFARMTTIFKAKANSVMDNLEDPNETLDYSYEKQLELLQKVRQGLADVVTSKKRLELQKAKLEQGLAKVDDQAKQALAAGREDLAREVLARKAEQDEERSQLDGQIAAVQAQQDKLTDTERKLSLKIEAFRTHKETIKAQYNAAQAQVKIGEATTGISEEMADVGLTMQRAQDKTERMQARAAAIGELTDSGALDDALEPGDRVDRELAKLQAGSKVDDELARLKKEMGQG